MKAHRTKHLFRGSHGGFARVAYDIRDLYRQYIYIYIDSPGKRIGIYSDNLIINNRFGSSTDAYPNINFKRNRS